MSTPHAGNIAATLTVAPAVIGASSNTRYAKAASPALVIRGMREMMTLQLPPPRPTKKEEEEEQEEQWEVLFSCAAAAVASFIGVVVHKRTLRPMRCK